MRTSAIVLPLLIAASFVGVLAVLMALARGSNLTGLPAGVPMRRSARKWKGPVAEAGPLRVNAAILYRYSSACLAGTGRKVCRNSSLGCSGLPNARNPPVVPRAPKDGGWKWRGGGRACPEARDQARTIQPLGRTGLDCPGIASGRQMEGAAGGPWRGSVNLRPCRRRDCRRACRRRSRRIATRCSRPQHQTGLPRRSIRSRVRKPPR